MDFQARLTQLKAFVTDPSTSANGATTAAAAALGTYVASRLKHAGISKLGKVVWTGATKSPLLALAALAGGYYLWKKNGTKSATKSQDTGDAAPGDGSAPSQNG